MKELWWALVLSGCSAILTLSWIQLIVGLAYPEQMPRWWRWLVRYKR